MNQRLRRFPAVTVALALCGALSSCSGGSSDGASSTSVVDVTTSVPEETVPETTDAAAVADTTPETTDTPSTTEPVPTSAATATTEPAATTTRPITTTLPTTTTQPATQATTQPATTTTPAQPTTTVAVSTTVAGPTGLQTLLVTAEDVGAGWELDEVYPYEQPPDEDTAVCAAYASINTIGGILTWATELSNDDFDSVFNAIGQGSPATLKSAVEEFALIAACDNTEAFGDGTSAGGVLDVAGADAASVLRFTPAIDDRSRTDLAVVAVGDTLLLIGVAWYADSEPYLSTFVDYVAGVAAAKVRNS